MTDSIALGHSNRMNSEARPGSTPATPLALESSPPDFEAAYHSTFDLVWRTLQRLGVQPAHLDDAAQDVFVVVHRRFGDFEGRSSLRTWIVGIAVRVAADYRRSLRRQGEQTVLDQELPDLTPGPAEAVSRSEARALVGTLLQTLREDQREVFVLVELEGLSVPEVAEALELKLNTTYSRLRLARNAFEGALAKRLADSSRRGL